MLDFKMQPKKFNSKEDLEFKQKYHDELDNYTLQQLIDLQKDLKKQMQNTKLVARSETTIVNP